MLLLDRDNEQAELDLVLVAVRDGLSRALVVRGEAGIGKTALLDQFIESAGDVRVVRVCGIESEIELGFAALHQLLVPYQARIDALPVPQRNALRIAFGLSEGDAPNPFLVGLAALTILAEAAEPAGLLCLVDDAQWLDHESAGALVFVARRLYADAIGIVFAVREPAKATAFDGLPAVDVGGLSNEASAQLLAATVPGHIDELVLKHLVGETGGNPLALIELAAQLAPEELTGAAALPVPLPIGRQLESRFVRQVRTLPTDTQTLLALAAADASGDVALIWRAAEYLGLSSDEASVAQREELLVPGSALTFRHPLIRSAVYQAASAAERRRIHDALARASENDKDARRRVWHRAAAAVGSDESIAAELEAVGDEARRRGGPAAAAAYLARAAQLTPDDRDRARRLLAAAQLDVIAGAPTRARSHLDEASAHIDDPIGRAQATRLRGTIRVALGDSAAAGPLFLEAAEALAPLDGRAARETLLDALSTSLYAGTAGPGVGLLEFARARARSDALQPDVPTNGDLLLDALATLFTDGHTAAAPKLRHAVAMLAVDDAPPTDEGLRWLGFGCWAAGALADNGTLQLLASRLERHARDAGALVAPTRALYFLGISEITAGSLSAAAAHFAESREIMAARGDTGGLGPLLVDAWRGHETETRRRADAAGRAATERGQRGVAIYADYALAVLENAMGNYAAALEAARRAEEADSYFLRPIALPELVEAASRAGDAASAVTALDALAVSTTVNDTPLANGLLARSRALLAADRDTEAEFVESIAALTEAGATGHLARSHLLYGEWLRREKRRSDARLQLRTAHGLFDAIGAEAFAERARSELLATGERARKRTVETRDELTPQEVQVARLAAAGATNAEIAAQLFLSPNTIEYHLRKVFRKLGITSRRQLRVALAE